MFQEEVERLLNKLQLGQDRVMRLTSWNLGSANCTIWRPFGVTVPEGEGKIFQDQGSSTQLQLISYQEYCAMREASMKESQKKKSAPLERSNRTCAKVMGKIQAR